MGDRRVEAYLLALLAANRHDEDLVEIFLIT
jgi:hypothetical protein